MALSQPFLSIVIPAHNEEKRLPPTLHKIDAFIKTQSYPVEVLVVENGSRDQTYRVASEFAAALPYVRVFQEAQRGKGLAVKRGMLAAQGAYRFICDADLSMPIEQVSRFLPPQQEDCDVVIGSREATGSARYNEPRYRHVIGRIFNLIVRLMALPGLQDSQCGFKCYRAAAAADIFKRQTLTSMSYDVEDLFIARKRGYHIAEAPIDWYFDPDSRVRLAQDSLRMFFDLVAIRWNGWRGVYG